MLLESVGHSTSSLLQSLCECDLLQDLQVYLFRVVWGLVFLLVVDYIPAVLITLTFWIGLPVVILGSPGLAFWVFLNIFQQSLRVTRWLKSYILCWLAGLALWGQTFSLCSCLVVPHPLAFYTVVQGKWGVLVTLPSSSSLTSLASPRYSPLGIFPSRKFSLHISFWQMLRHANMGVGFSPSKVTWEPDQSVGPLEPPNAPCQMFFWMSVILLSASLLSWAIPFVLLGPGSWPHAWLTSAERALPAATWLMTLQGMLAVWLYPGTVFVKANKIKCAWIYNVVSWGKI